MFVFLLAYFGGILTILSPCILPVLPFAQFKPTSSDELRLWCCLEFLG